MHTISYVAQGTMMFFVSYHYAALLCDNGVLYKYIFIYLFIYTIFYLKKWIRQQAESL